MYARSPFSSLCFEPDGVIMWLNAENSEHLVVEITSGVEDSVVDILMEAAIFYHQGTLLFYIYHFYNSVAE